jgi:hypothetical protein
MSDITIVTSDNNVTIIETIDEPVQITITNPEPVRLITASTQGPPGPPGTKITYVHDQSSASTLWIITHNLDCYPSVMVVDSTKREVLVGIQYIDENVIHVSSDYAFAGQAFLN